MNLESLRRKLANETKSVEIAGTQWRFCRLGLTDGLAVAALIDRIPKTGDGDNLQAKNPEDLAALYSLVISKTAVDENGAKTLDCDEGRSLLERLPREEFLAVGEAAMEWAAGPEKKS